MEILAQTFDCHVVTDRGEIYCAFEFDDATAVHYFDVDITKERLRFGANDAGSGIIRTAALEVHGQSGP